MSDLGKKVLDAIASRGLEPKPYARFLARRSMFWALAVLSVLLGGISVAVALFVIEDFMSTGGRGFDEMPFDDIAQSLPVVWLVIFLLFMASAWFGFAHTRRGYRHRPAAIVVLAMLISIALGLVFHFLEAGKAVHELLSAQFPAYREFTYVPYDEWRRPDEGYLGGEALAVDEETKTLRLKDFDGREWTVDISTAVITVEDPLVEEGDVAITGERTGPLSFKATRIDEFD